MILTILTFALSFAALVVALQSRKYRIRAEAAAARSEAAAVRSEAAARESAALRETQP